MTMTCHVLHAGDGYTYLTNQVASADVTRSAHDPLVDYYTAAGNPPGQWVGSGVADLGAFIGEVVTEEHMFALFGEGLHPDANAMIAARIDAGMSYEKALAAARLGRRFYQFTNSQPPLVTAVQAAYAEFEMRHSRRPSVEERRDIKERVAGDILAGPDGSRPAAEVIRRYITNELGKAHQPVAGFDLVFSPVKSVSVLWALGGHQVRQVVEQVHEDAWRAALAYAEREAAFTRVGKNGVAQIDTSGFVATAFVHRDSRAGDPDLHTHVAVSNRVRGLDGQWRTPDSKQMHKVAVSASEYYNAALEQGLTAQLGVRWTEVAARAGKRAVREIDGIPREWIQGFSQRRQQVEDGVDDLVADYVRRYGHTPPRDVQMKLAQQAALADRPEKQALRTLAEQVADWTTQAQGMLPGQDIDAVLAAALGRSAVAAGPVDVADLAARVVEVVSEHRSTWTVYHVRAEAIRQLKAHGFATAQARDHAVEQVTDAALGTESVELAVQLDPPPTLLQRANGESVYERHGATRYTSQAILDAETRLLHAARRIAGPVVPEPVVKTVISRYEQSTGRTLDAGQRALVEQFTGCGQAVSVAIGPPGSGKSTAMRLVRSAWESTGHRVIGLAPSAGAARVLGDELGVHADTLHSLALAWAEGREVDVRAGDMLLVDEAGMAGTPLLDQVRALAAERGAVLRLVGDYRQLSAVEAGGALRLIHTDAGGTELARLHRFADPAEANAVLALRVGDTSAGDFYANHERLHGGARAAVLDQLYAAWKADTAAGRTSIMISDSNEVATELSGRAQAERRAAGTAEPGGIALHDGTIAGRGDRVVTRRNARGLRVHGGRDWVKNGDLWDVEARFDDGRLRVRNARHGGRITLPASYIAEHVELGYAATIHRSQGVTVDVTRAYLSPMAVREAALVALSRGIQANHAYFDTDEILGTAEPEVLPGDLFYRYRESIPAAAALAAVIRREGAELSATEQLREALDAPYRLDVVVPQYLHALAVYRGPAAAEQATGWVRRALPDRAEEILADPAWPKLASVLADIHATGADPAAVLADRAASRPLEDDPTDPARSVAQVLHYRITEHAPTAAAAAGRPELLPGWVPTPPSEADEQGLPAELGAWLRGQAEQIAKRVQQLGQRAAETTFVWTTHLGPVPDDPILRQTWLASAGQVAAYRERFSIPDTEPALLPGGEAGEAARAHAWVGHHLATTRRSSSDASGSAATTPPASEQQARPQQTHRQESAADRAVAAASGLLTPTPKQQHLRNQQINEQLREGLDQLRAAHELAAREEQQRQAVREQEQQQRAEHARAWGWSEREYGHLTDRELSRQIRDEHAARDDALARQHDRQREFAELGPQVAAGAGPNVRRLDERLAALRHRGELAREIVDLGKQREQQRSDSARANESARVSERIADRAPWWRPGLRLDETANAQQQRQHAREADAEAARLAEHIQALVEQAGGGRTHWPAVVTDANRAEENYQQDREKAQAADKAELDLLRRNIAGNGATASDADRRIGDLTAEKDLRANMPRSQAQQEDSTRSQWRTEQRTRSLLEHARRQRAERDNRYTLDHGHDLHRGLDQQGPHLGM